jgi:hypothetical protein
MKNSKSRETIKSYLEYARAPFSIAEENFINRYIVPRGSYADSFGNHFIRLGTGDKKIALTCHTDTIHHFGGKQELTQQGEWLQLKNQKRGFCLGADDGAGIYAINQLVDNFKRGLYSFDPEAVSLIICYFRDEERGGCGSAFAAKNSNLFDDIPIIISLDRQDQNDIVISQLSASCCSDNFTIPLMNHFNSSPAHGSFTDSATWMDLPANCGFRECTNLSVGYENQHSGNERLNTDFLLDFFIPKLLSFDWGQLTATRVPNDFNNWDYSGNYSGGYSGNYSDLEDYVYRNPATVSDYLDSCGISVNDLKSWGGES